MRSIPQLRGVARREYTRMLDYFLALMAGFFLLTGFSTALMLGDVKVFFYCGLACFACTVFAVVVGGIVAVVLGKTKSGYDYRLDSDGLEVQMAGFSRVIVGAGAAAASTNPLRAGMAAGALSNLSRGIPWTELSERGVALEVVPAEYAVILHEPWKRWSLFSKLPRAIYLFCETDERLTDVLKLIRQCLPGIEEKPAAPSRWQRRLRIAAIVFMMTGIIGSAVF